MVKFDAFKTAINVLRSWFDEKLDKFDDKIVQSDYAQSDPEQPDYVRNRIVYDNRQKSIVIPKQNLGAFVYIGTGYACVLPVNAGFVEGNLYEVICNDVKYYTRCYVKDDCLTLAGHPETRIFHIQQYNSEELYVVTYYISIAGSLAINAVEDDETKRTKLPADMAIIPAASTSQLGGVMVGDRPYSYSPNPVFVDVYGRAVTAKEVPLVGKHAAGRFLRVNSDGKWDDEEVDVALKSDIPTDEHINALIAAALESKSAAEGTDN